MKNYNDFTEQKISKLFWRYALPAIIATTVNTLYNIIDGIFIGHWIGKEALSAAGLILPIMTIAAAIGLLVGVGAASRISIYLGKQSLNKAEEIIGSSFLLTLLLSGITLIFLLIFIDPLLYLVGASEVTHTYAKEFLQVFLPGSLFLTLSFNYANMMRACGYPLKAMLIMLLSVVLNIILAPIFIKSLNWGMRGAALATTLSMMLSFILVIAHFVSKKSTVRLRLKYIRINKEAIFSILSIGISPFTMQVATSIVVVFINWQLNFYAPLSHIRGDDAIAAFSNANRLITLIVMIVIGINQGMQPIIGYNYGAQKHDRVKQTFFYAVKVATMITGIGFLLGMFIPNVLVSAFTPDKDMIELSSTALRYITLLYILLGFQMVTTSFFQCIGMAKVSIILSLSRQVLILLPMLYILPEFWQLNGVWFASPVSDLLASILAYLALYWYFKSVNSRYKLTPI